MTVFGMDVSTFATLCMAVIAFLTLGFTIIVQIIQNKKIRKNDENHILELELSRYQKELSEVREASLKIDEGINSFEIQNLCFQIVRADVLEYEHITDEIADLYHRTKSILLRFHLVDEICLKYDVQLYNKIVMALDRYYSYVYQFHMLMKLLMGVGVEDMALQVKSNKGILMNGRMTSVVTGVDIPYQNLMKFCEENGYESMRMKENVMLYLRDVHAHMVGIEEEIHSDLIELHRKGINGVEKVYDKLKVKQNSKTVK